MLTQIQKAIGQLATHQGFRRYFANTSWLFGEQILRIVTGLLVGIYVARYLGPHQFGIYSYAIAFVTPFNAIARMGVDSIVLRDLINHPEFSDIYLGTAFWLKLVGALSALCVLAIVTQLTGNDARTNLYIFIIASGLIFHSFDVVDFHFQSRVLSKYVALCKLVQMVLSSMLKLYFILTQADLLSFVLVSLFDQISLAVSLAFVYWRQKIGSFFGKFKFVTAKEMLKSSWPLFLTGIVTTLYMRVDQIMIKEMLGEREVGLYSAAVRISEAWYFVPIIIIASLFPAVVNAKRTSQTLYRRRLQRLYTLITWLTISVALSVTFLGDWIMTLLYGSSYKESGIILSIHIWTGVFVGLGIATERLMINENLVIASMLRAMAGMVLNVLFNFILIPMYGICGSAVALLFSQIFSAYVFDLFSLRTRELFIMKSKSIFLYKALV